MSWPLVKLGDICDLLNGYAFKSSDYVESSNTLSCRMSNIRPGGVFDIEYNARFLPDDFTTKYSKFMLNDGDVIIAMTDLADSPKILGVPTVVKTGGKNILLNQRVGKLFIKETDKVYFPYLKLALNYPRVRAVYKQFAGGGLQINLGKKDLLSVEIPLPPLDEQKRIAAILDKADAIRQKRKQAIDLADEFLRSVFLDMFGDVSGVGESTVEKLAEDRKGSMRTGPFGSQLLHSEFTESGVSVLGIDNAVKNRFEWGKERFISQDKYSELSRYTVLPGDVLITIMGTCGRCAVVPEDIPVAINTKHLCCITLDKSKCLPEFLHSYFLYHPIARRYLEKNTKGAIMAGLNMGIVKAMPVPVFPLAMQNKYVEIAKKIESSRYNREEFETLGNRSFDSISQKAFSGQL